MLWSQDMYAKAWHVASLAHDGQTYCGTEKGQVYPYIHHIALVAMELMSVLPQSAGCNANLGIQCALLHDTIEDTDHDYASLNALFGSAVANGVLALSKNPNVGNKKAQMLDSLERIQQQPREIWMVKLADRITNMSSPPFHWSVEKCVLYRDEALLILQVLGGAHDALAQRLAQRIHAYRPYAVNSCA